MVATVVGTFVLLTSSVAVLCLKDRPNITDLGHVSEAHPEKGHHADETPILAMESNGESDPPSLAWETVVVTVYKSRQRPTNSQSSGRAFFCTQKMR